MIFRYFYNKNYLSFEKFFNDFLDFLINSKYKKKIMNINETTIEKYLSDIKFYTKADRYFRYLRNELFSDLEFKKITIKFMRAKKFDYKSNKIFKKIWMTVKDIKTISDYGHHIGLHSYTHNNEIFKMKFNKQMYQYRKNLKDIKKITGVLPKSASYPYNSFNKDSKKILKKLEIDHVFLARSKNLSQSNFEIKRYDITEI